MTHFLQIALFVLSSAGFGQRISWRDEGVRREGFEMSFKVSHQANSRSTKLSRSLAGNHV